MEARLAKAILGATLIGAAVVAVALLRRTRNGTTVADRLRSGQAAPAAVQPRLGRSEIENVSRDELYREAQRRDIPGRSSMKKAELQAALAEGA